MSLFHYSISEVAPLIDWLYFYHAWQMNSRTPQVERERLQQDALRLMEEWGSGTPCHAVLQRVEAHSDGDDIVIDSDSDSDFGSEYSENSECSESSKNFKTHRLPMLRQQTPPYLCMADFVHPEHDMIGLFATSVSDSLPHLHDDSDQYMHLLAQTTADRLAEATAERISQDMPGIRPAVGYPSMPDMSMTFVMDSLLALSRIGISLTESGAMRPHASVCGIIIQHPEARYFHLGPIGDDQRADYARRRGLTIEQILKFIPKWP